MALNSPGGSILQCFNLQVTRGWHAIDWIRLNVRHIGILHLVSISTTSPQTIVILRQSAKFYPNRTTLGRKKWRYVDLQDGGSQPTPDQRTIDPETLHN